MPEKDGTSNAEWLAKPATYLHRDQWLLIRQGQLRGVLNGTTAKTIQLVIEVLNR